MRSTTFGWLLPLLVLVSVARSQLRQQLRITQPLRTIQLKVNETVPITPYNERWMENLFDILQNRTMLDITLPGTHNSGAYVLFEEMLVGPVLQDLIDRAEELGIPVYDLIDGWSICQTRTFYQQLAGGIRSLDLRAVWDGENWRTEHGLLGLPIQIMLDDIRLFLDTHSHEIVHVLIGNLAGTTEGDLIRQQLLDQIENTLSPYLIPLTVNLDSPIGELISRNQRVIVFYPNAVDIALRTVFWNNDKFGEGQYANANEIEAMINHNKNLMNTLGGNNKLFTLSWTLTPQVEDIVKGLRPSAEIRNLYQMVRFANDALDPFFHETTNRRFGNVLIVDFFEETNIVEVAKAWNRRDCNDDVEYRARTANETDCRSRAERGQCISNESFMRTHCQLSCGWCKIPVGEPSAACQTNQDCLSNHCGPTNVCLTDDPLPSGASCGVNEQCASANCDTQKKACL